MAYYRIKLPATTLLLSRFFVGSLGIGISSDKPSHWERGSNSTASGSWLGLWRIRGTKHRQLCSDRRVGCTADDLFLPKLHGLGGTRL
jgi:hypothetical protein